MRWNRARLERLVLLGGVAAAVVFGCGGMATLDGGDGSGGSSSSGTALCATPDPEGTLVPCNTVAVAGTTASGFGCSTTSCDDGGNTWESRCEGSGCQCLFNGQLRCSCSLEGSGQFCVGSTPSCCPAPFPE